MCEVRFLSEKCRDRRLSVIMHEAMGPSNTTALGGADDEGACFTRGDSVGEVNL